MKIRKIAPFLIALSAILASCNKDDDNNSSTTPPRDSQEVYDEDIVKIEDYLSTHFYNYEDFDFDNPYSEANDTFQIVFDTIAGDNSDKTPLIDRPELHYKIVTDDDVDYMLYYLMVREGDGDSVHFTDKVYSTYEGITIPDNIVFDIRTNRSAPPDLDLVSTASQGGIIPGFAQTFVEFKTSSNFSNNNDGTVEYHGHGIGATFIPSGLGYFNTYVNSIGGTYVPLIFKFDLLKRTIMDHDVTTAGISSPDGIPSFLEDIDGSGSVYDDDTDEDGTPNYLDVDDDNDLVTTRNEIDFSEYVINLGDDDPEFAANEYEVGRVEENGQVTISTVILTDTDGDGTPDYLDPDTAIED